MINLITPLIAPIASYFTKRIEAKKDIKLKEIDQVVNADDKLAAWEEIQAKNSGDSFKDEFWTVVFAIPLIMCFIPGLVQYVHQGFAVLKETPEWYQYTLMTLVFASVGVRWIKK